MTWDGYKPSFDLRLSHGADLPKSIELSILCEGALHYLRVVAPKSDVTPALPHFLYRDVLYFNLNAISLWKLTVAFNACVRYIYGLPYQELLMFWALTEWDIEVIDIWALFTSFYAHLLICSSFKVLVLRLDLEFGYVLDIGLSQCCNKLLSQSIDSGTRFPLNFVEISLEPVLSNYIANSFEWDL